MKQAKPALGTSLDMMDQKANAPKNRNALACRLPNRELPMARYLGNRYLGNRYLGKGAQPGSTSEGLYIRPAADRACRVGVERLGSRRRVADANPVAHVRRVRPRRTRSGR